MERRDGDRARFGGQGVLGVLGAVTGEINAIVGVSMAAARVRPDRVAIEHSLISPDKQP